MVAEVQVPLGMYTQKSLSSSARSATASDEEGLRRRRRRSHSKDSSFLGLSKAALRFFKLSNFACNARTSSEAVVDGEAHTGKKPDEVRRKWRFLRPRAGGDVEGSAASQTGRSGELARPKSHIKSELGEKNPHDEEEAIAVEKKREETLFHTLLSEEDCADGSTIGKSNAVGSDKIVSFSQFLTSDDGPVELQKEAPYSVSGNAKNHGDGEDSFKGAHDACDRVLKDQPGQKEECGEEEDEVLGTGMKHDAFVRWCFLEPREEANEGFAASQTRDSGELAHLKNHVQSELGEMKPRHGEEVNAVDKKSKETLFDMLLREEEDSAGRSTIGQRNVIGSDKIMNCTLSQFLIRDDGPAELQKEASNYDTWNASKNGDGEASFKVHDAGGRVLMDQQGQKEECGDEEEVLNDSSTDIVMVSAGSKGIKAQWRNPRTKYNTLRLLREMARLVPADNPVSVYVSKMLCAVGRARDLFQPILFRVNLKKEFLVVLSASHASLASLATAKMRKSLKHDTGAPAPQEMWTKEIIMGRRCKERSQEGFSTRWSNAKEVPVTCHAEALERCYSFKELMEMADKF